MVVATLSGDQPHRPHTFFSLNEHLTPPEASQHWLSRLIWTSSLRHTDTAVTTIQAVPVRTLGAEEEPPELQRIPTRSVPFSEDYGPPMDSYDSFNALPTLMYIQNDRLMHRRSISTHSAPAAFRPSLSPIESETGDLDYSLSALPDIVDTVSSKPIWNRGSRYSTGATSLGAYPLRLRLRRNTSSSSLAYDDKFNQGVSSAPNGVHLAVRDSVDFHGNGWNLHTLYTISVEVCLRSFLSLGFRLIAYMID